MSKRLTVEFVRVQNLGDLCSALVQLCQTIFSLKSHCLKSVMGMLSDIMVHFPKCNHCNIFCTDQYDQSQCYIFPNVKNIPEY